MSVSLSSGVTLDNLVTANTDPVTGRIDFPASDCVIPPAKPSNTIVFVGDSMTGQGNIPIVSNYGDMTLPLPTSTSFPAVTSYADKGYVNWALACVGQRLRLLRNAGVGSNRLEHILARLDADVLSLKPRYVSILAGYNNIVNDDTYDNIVTQMSAIFFKIRKAGCFLIACTVLPNATYINAAPARLAVWLKINNWIKAYCQQQDGCFCVDTAESVMDVTTGGEVSGAYQTDNIHPAMKGARLVGQFWAARVDTIIPKSSILLGSPLDLNTNFGQGNILPGGRMVGTGGSNSGTGMSGSVATGWTHQLEYGTATSVASKVSRTDEIKGEWQQIAVSAMTGSSAVRLQKSISSGAATFVAGDTISAQAELAIDSATAIDYFYVQAQVQDSGYSDLAVFTAMLNGPASTVGAFSGVLKIPDFIVPAGAVDHITFKILAHGTTGSAITFRVGRCEMRNLSK